jgi:hypothetical protein
MKKLNQEELNNRGIHYSIEDYDLYLDTCPDCAADLLIMIDKSIGYAALKFLKHNT